MKIAKKRNLEAAGWKVGTVAEFLDLDATEAAMVELRVSLARTFRRRRMDRGLTQTQAARAIGSSQSRVAKMEAADASVSLDLLIRSLLALQAQPREISAAIAKAGS